jgi:hypothetical protein
MGWNADAHDDIVPCEFGTFVRYADYLTLAQQRDAAVRERAECVAREQRWMARLAAAEAALATIRDDAHTTLDLYDKNGPQWTSSESGEEYYSASYVLETARTNLATAQGASVDDDFGPNDGHARTVRRTPPQDAATTRGE